MAHCGIYGLFLNNIRKISQVILWGYSYKPNIQIENKQNIQIKKQAQKEIKNFH